MTDTAVAPKAMAREFRAALQISGSWRRRAYHPSEKPCQPVLKREALKELITRMTMGS